MSSSRVLAALRGQRIETPSWGYANSGTRFKVFGQPGVPRTPREKIDDAAVVHRFTGIGPSVALHIPWDRVGDYGALAKHAAEQGVTLGRSTPTRSRTTSTGWAAWPAWTGGRAAGRSGTCTNASTSWTRPGRAT